MNPMIETAARAMAGASWDVMQAEGMELGGTRDEFIERNWERCAVVLNPALRAMREVPASEAMYLAWLACYGNYVHSEDDLRTQASDTWRALLGAIVDQGGE